MLDKNSTTDLHELRRPEFALPASNAVQFFQTGGAMALDSPSYVPRQADGELLEALLTGELCYVLDTRQVGKTSLLARVAERLRAVGYRVAFLDLTAAGQNVTASEWYAGLLDQVALTEPEMDAAADFWESRRGATLGPCQRWFTTLSEVFVKRDKRPFVIIVDEIDFVRSLPFAPGEFFAAIRACYQRRVTEPEYRRLTFLLAGAATPAQLIDDDRITPFNIGRRIELTDFTATEASHLAPGLLPVAAGSMRQATVLLERVLYWTGGHPYLTQRLCRSLVEAFAGSDAPRRANVADVDRLCREVFLTREARETGENLTFARNRMLSSDNGVDPAALLALYERVRKGASVPFDPTDPLSAILRLSGVASVRGGRLVVRNRIYKTVFDRRWIEASLPGEELRRQRRAFRLGLIRASAAWTAAAAIAGSLLWLRVQASSEHDRADRATLENTRASALARSLASDVHDSRVHLAELDAGRREAESHLEALARQEAQDKMASELARRRMADALRREGMADARAAGSEQGLEETRRQVARASADLARFRRQSAESEAALAAFDGLWASTLATRQGQEFGALEFGLKATEPDVLAGHSPLPDSLQGLADAVNTGAVRRMHFLTPQRGTISAVSWDGAKMLVGTVGQQGFIVNPDTGRLLRGMDVTNHVPEAVGFTADSVDFSRDGRFALTASSEVVHTDGSPAPNLARGQSGRRVRIWDLNAPRRESDGWMETPLSDLYLPVSYRAQAAFAESASNAAVASGQSIPHFSVVTSTNNEDIMVWDSASLVQMAKQGQRIVTPDTAAPKRLTPAPFAVDKDKAALLQGLVVSPDGRRVATAGRYSGITVYDLVQNRRIFDLPYNGRTTELRALCFLDNDTIAFVDGNRAQDGTTYLHFWKLGERIPFQIGDNYERADPGSFAYRRNNWIWSVDAWSSANLIVSGDSVGKTSIWSAQSGVPPLLEWRTTATSVNDVKFNPKRSEVLTVSSDNAVEVWALTASVFPQRAGNILAAEWGHGGRWIASAGSAGRIEIHDAAAPLGTSTLGVIEAPGPIDALAFSPVDDIVAAAIPSGEGVGIYVWDVRDPARPRLLHTLRGSDPAIPEAKDSQRFGPPRSLDFSHDGTKIAAGWDNGADVWDIASGQRSGFDRFNWGGAGFIARFSPDDSHIWIAGTDGSLRGWSRQKHSSESENIPASHSFASGGNAYPKEADQSPVAPIVATADKDGRVYLWHVWKDGEQPRLHDEPIGIFAGHRGAVMSVRFSPDGAALATSGVDGDIRLWDVARMQAAMSRRKKSNPNDPIPDNETQPLVIHASKKGGAGSVRWAPNGQHIVTSGDDGVARIFPATAAAYVKRAHEILALRPAQPVGLGSLPVP